MKLTERELLGLSPRSILYDIGPIGLGTPYVESLTSYISRLAEYHCLSTGIFISKLLAPYLNKYYITAIASRGGNGFYDSSNGINGIGRLAEDFVYVLGMLTYKEDLFKLTLLPWSTILPTRSLMESKKKWCPVCYEDALNNRTIIYDPLIWFLKDRKYCFEHKTTLVSNCIKCSKQINYLSRNSKTGFCDYCDSWLGCSQEEVMKEDYFYEETIEMGKRVEELLEISSGIENLMMNKDQIINSLNYYLTEVFNGNTNKFAKFSGVPKTTFHYWVKGINLPALGSLLGICIRLKIGLMDFLEMKQVEGKDSYRINLSPIQTKDRKKFDHEKIKNMLLKELKSLECNSLTKVAKKIGCDRKLLYNKFPHESKKIVENYTTNIEIQKNKRKENYEKELIKTIYKLRERNIYPSRRTVEKELKGKFLLKESYMRELWKDLKNSF